MHLDEHSKKKYPLISIIIPVINAEKYINESLKSIKNQEFNDYEVIVIDGGSVDRSLEIIHQYESIVSTLVSEPDAGIYDAMNKGINLATGEWLYFLGADDQLCSGILEKVYPFLQNKYSAVFGDVIFSNGYRMRSFLGKRTILQNTLHHQSVFYYKSIFSSFRYNNNLRISADYELNLMLYLTKSPVLYIAQTIARCYEGGTSSHLDSSLTETNKVRRQYIKSKLKCILLDFLLYVYYFQKKIRRITYGHQV